MCRNEKRHFDNVFVEKYSEYYKKVTQNNGQDRN